MRVNCNSWAPRFCAIVLALAVAVESRAADRVTLDRAVIVSDPNQASFVQYGVEDMAGFLKDVTGHETPVVAAIDNSQPVQIVIGLKLAREVLPSLAGDTKIGEEDYVLKSIAKEGAQYILAVGATDRGTKQALAVLMRTIQVEGRAAFVPAALDVVGHPTFARRGVHFNGWAFGYPYTFRCWREKDWQQYLDILSYQGVNLFYLWPFIEIMPVPLSTEDQAYLEECRRVVDYAQKKHGMEVWIMQCTNRVANDRLGTADPRHRLYWRACQQDLNPANPEHFKAIMQSREAMYRIIDNVDGVCNIDSDPGYSPAGSTLDDYIKVLQGCRAMLDRHNIHGKQAKLIHWMWGGWGRPENVDAAQHQLHTIQRLKQDLPEPWGLICGMYRYVPICRQEGVLEKTVLLPYNEVECEPSYPTTNVQLDRIRTAFYDEIAKFPELGGVMGNVQTPLLQFPHIYFYTSILSNPGYRKQSEKEALLDLAGDLYPEQRQLIADCYLAMKECDPSKIDAVLNPLSDLVQQDNLGTPGIFGRKLFPDHRIVAQSLVLQLKMHIMLEKLVAGITRSASTEECEKLIGDYFSAYIDWDMAHNWHTVWGWQAPPPDVRLKVVFTRLKTRLVNQPAIDAFFNRIIQDMSAKHKNCGNLSNCVNPWRNSVAATPVCVSVVSLAQKAKATASKIPEPAQYPPSAANDGFVETLYWPGGLTQDNTEWLQLTWDKPQTFSHVVVRFLQHPSMTGRTIHLQKEAAAGQWEDFAATKIPDDPKAPHSVATFNLPAPVTLDKIRIVNLLDLFEVDVH